MFVTQLCVGEVTPPIVFTAKHSENADATGVSEVKGKRLIKLETQQNQAAHGSNTLPSFAKCSYRSSSVTFGDKPLTYRLNLVSLLWAGLVGDLAGLRCGLSKDMDLGLFSSCRGLGDLLPVYRGAGDREVDMVCDAGQRKSRQDRLDRPQDSMSMLLGCEVSSLPTKSVGPAFVIT